MKIRTIKYGYNYINGVIEVNPKEKDIVKQIFADYISGKSLSKIAEKLNNSGVVYFQGQTGWNKARLKRIIEDRTYVGLKQYTAIIDEAIFLRANEAKNSKNTQKDVNRDDNIYNLRVPIMCGLCGTEMKRSYQKRLKNGTKWICINPDCKHSEQLSDEYMLSAITDLLNLLISNNEMITIENTKKYIGNESIKLENEVNILLARNEIDKQKLRKKIFENTSFKYQNINNDKYITKKLKADFDKQSLLSAFSLELFHKTVTAITLYNGSITVTLKNGQKVCNGNEYNTSS